MEGFHWCLLSLSSIRGLVLPGLPLCDVHDLLLFPCLMPGNTVGHPSLSSWCGQRPKKVFPMFILCFAGLFPYHVHLGWCLFPEVLELSSFHTFTPPVVLLSPLQPFSSSCQSSAPGGEGTSIIQGSRTMALELSQVLTYMCSLPLIKNIPVWVCFLNS